MTTTVRLLNPLPRALAHYQSALVSCVQGVGSEVTIGECVDISLTDAGARRLPTTAKAIAERISYRDDSAYDHVIVLWPAFGYLDPILWSNSSRTSIVFHDPAPLRRQFGLSPLSSWVAARIQNRRSPQILAHSSAARDEICRRGLAVGAVLPLPMTPPVPSWRPTDQVTVLGQFKRARDLPVLEKLGGLLRQRGLRPVICGRGWPRLAGWEVHSRFLSEDEFQEQIQRSVAVVVPYTRVFQSDVAVRAAELGVPVVAPRSSNVPELFGEDWEGLVERYSPAEAWLSAVRDVGDLSHEIVSQRVWSAHRRITDCWADWLK